MLLVLPASASAWTLTAESNATGKTLVWSGTAGAESARVTDAGGGFVDASDDTENFDNPSPPAGCTAPNARTLRCQISAFAGGTMTQVRFDLGAGSDGAGMYVALPTTFNGGTEVDFLYGGPAADVLNGGEGNDNMYARGGADQVNGGPGDDTMAGGNAAFLMGWMGDGAPDLLAGGPGADTALWDGSNLAVNVSLDDQPNDGEAGEGDNVQSDVENATTGIGNDKLVGNGGANTFKSSGGADDITGGGGADDLQSGAGQDTVDARDFGADTIDCGTGGGPGEPENDTVKLDDVDTDVNCENRTVSASDADGDGVRGDTDCNDADAAIKPGAAEIAGNEVDENCDGVAEPTPPAGPASPESPAPPAAQPAAPVFKTPRLNASLGTAWTFSGSATIVKKLQVKPAPAGSTIVVTCKGKGKGCAFKKKTLRLTRGLARQELAQLFKKRKLKAGAVIEVRVTKPGSIGRVFVATIRRKKRPKLTTQCLPPGASRPAACV
jgi:hypothetical protein